MTKRIVEKDGVEYEIEEKVTEEEMTIQITIPDRSYRISEEKLKEYENSPQWKELDDLYKELISGERNEKEILQKIVSYGEIAIAKHSKDAMGFLEVGFISQDFMNIPFYLEMPTEIAIDILERKYSDDKDTSIIASIELNEYIKDFRIEELIEILENSRKANDDEVANGAMGELYRIGEFALPQIKIKVAGNLESQFEFDLINVALAIICGEEKSQEIIQKLFTGDSKDFDEANTKLTKLINDIDIESYIVRHPDFMENM